MSELEHLDERITEMCAAGQTTPEAVRCLVSEFAGASLHDWGCAFCMVPFFPDVSELPLHERMARRITEMCLAGQTTPEVVRCLLSEFAGASLHDWGCAFCMTPFPPEAVPNFGPESRR